MDTQSPRAEPVPVVGVVIGLVNTLLGITNLVLNIVRGDKTQDQLKKLDTLIRGQADIIGRLKVILSEIQWTQITVLATDAVTNIQFQFQRISQLLKGDTASAETWARQVLDPNKGLSKDLFVINQLLMGQSLLGSPLMEVFVKKIMASPTSQSPYYEAMVYFRAILNLQAQGVAALANAYTYLNPDKDGTDYVKPYVDTFKEQAEYNKQFISGLDKYYSSPAWGENQPNNFFYIHGPSHYVDANPNMADFPHIVVGFQLYLKHDRTALKILQALLDNQGEVDPTTAMWKNAPGGWGDSGPDNYFDLSPDHYVDTNEVIVPVGHVVTGAQLYKKNNRIAIKLYSKPYDQDTRQLAPDYRTETEFSDMNGNYFTIREKGFNFVNSNMVQPNPLSFVTGAQLYPYGNRIALKQRTAYYTL